MGNIFGVQNKGQEGSIAQLDWQELQRALGAFGLDQNRVELRISCCRLPKKDLLSMSDPMAVMYKTAATGQTEWKELGRTEVMANCPDPAFVRPLLASYSSKGTQPCRIVVYDVDRRGDAKSLKLASQDYIGEAEFNLSDVMMAPRQTLELPLVDVKAGKQLPPGCVVVIKGEQLAPNDNRIVRLAFSGEGLRKKGGGLAGCNPFLQALKLRALPNGGQGKDDWVPVFRTEVRESNDSPAWAPIEVDIRQLCSADETRPLKLQVWNHSSSGQHVMLGEVQTSLAALRAIAPGPYTGPEASVAPAGTSAADVAAPPAKDAGALIAPAPAPGAAAPGFSRLETQSATVAYAPAAGGLAPMSPPSGGEAAASHASGRGLELTLPGGGLAGKLVVRTVAVRPGVTPTQSVLGCLRGCMGG